MFLRRLGRSSARGGFSGVVYPSHPKAVAAALDTSVTEFVKRAAILSKQIF